MILKIINTLLILIAVYMGLKQGWAMIQGKQQMLDMFGKWHFSKTGIAAFGIITILSALLILFPKTFVWVTFDGGKYSAYYLSSSPGQGSKGAGVELPFSCSTWLLSICNIHSRKLNSSGPI